ncbi:DUF7619 domain-containing protein [Rasiella sp. SM2506]|uniref:DUF7619 domain-containing protein n=1 Tax=Rasiella sp. SM2506 TaxID=3423914 RepID=UPI003D7B9B91
MKNILLLLAFAISATSISQIVDIPDPLFKEHLLNQINPLINTNGDTEIQVSEAQAAEKIRFSNFSQFTDLTGIEAFVNLEEITGQNYAFTSIDLSSNNNLKNISLTIGDLEEIILPNQTTNLERISLFSNNFNDFSTLNNYSNLNTVSVFSNESLGELNVSNLSNLEVLRISNTEISEIDLSNNLNLQELSIANTNISDIDIASFNLKFLSFGENIQSINLSSQTQLEELIITGVSLPSLDLSGNTQLSYLSISNYPFTNIDLSSNTNLEEMYLSGDVLTSLDLQNNSALLELNISEQNLETINLSGCNQLESLIMDGIQSLQSLDTSNNRQLIEVELSGTRFIGQENTVLDTIDLSQNTALEFARIQYFDGLIDIVIDGATSLNSLHLFYLPSLTLDFNSNTNLQGLLLSGLPYETIDVSQLSNLNYFSLRYMPTQQLIYPKNNNIKALSLHGTGYTELDLSVFDSLCWLRLWDNLFLENVNISTIDLSDMASGSTCTEGLYFLGNVDGDLQTKNNPNLRFICVDDASFAAANFTDTVEGYVTFTEDCSLSGSDLNTIEGALSFDLDGNNCATGASAIPNRLVLAQGNDFMLGTATNETGNYQLNVGEGAYTNYLPNFSNIYNVNPEEATNTFVGYGNVENEDFCVQAAQTVNDLNIAVGANNQPTLQGGVSYSIVYENAGTTPQNAVITYTYNDTKLNFISANPAPTSQTSGSATWDLGVLNPVNSGSIYVSFSLPGAPLNEIGDSLDFTARVEPVAGDATPEDNTFDFTDFIEAEPFAPLFNGSQPDQILIDEADEYLYFSVCFDNFTPQAVENAVVYFSTTGFININMETVQVMAVSHPVTTMFAEGTFYFYMNDINLAPLLSSGGEEQGYITFRFKPVNGIEAGDRVQFQPQISLDGYHTNAFTSVEYVTELGVEDNIIDIKEILLYPNPTTGIITISSTENIQSIDVYSLTGQLLKTKSNLQQTEVTLSIEELAAGIYFARVSTESGEKVFRVVKK